MLKEREYRRKGRTQDEKKVYLYKLGDRKASKGRGKRKGEGGREPVGVGEEVVGASAPFRSSVCGGSAAEASAT